MLYLCRALAVDTDQGSFYHVLPRLKGGVIAPANLNVARPIEQSLERLRNATHDQVVQLYRDYLGSQAGELTIVGDFDATACLSVLKKSLSGWKAAKPYERIKMPLQQGCRGRAQDPHAR